MSVRHILKSKAIINTVLDARKGEVVKGAVEGRSDRIIRPRYWQQASEKNRHPIKTIFVR